MQKTDRPKARTIIEQAIVSKRLDKSKQEYPRLTSMFDAVKWRLAREPFKGATRVPDTIPIRYVIHTKPWKAGMVPALKILYRVSGNDVIIESLAIHNDE